MSTLAHWLGVYLVQSTLLIGVALVAQRWLRSASLREIVLRVAVLGSVASAVASVAWARRDAAASADGTRLIVRVEREVLAPSAAGTDGAGMPPLAAPPSRAGDAVLGTSRDTSGALSRTDPVVFL